jgi:hypothetical protein
MPKLSLEVKQTVEPKEVVAPFTELTIEQQQTLLREIALYEALAEEAAENVQLLDAQKGELNRLRASFGLGAKSVSPADGFLLTLVQGESSSLDKKGLMKRYAITPSGWAEFQKKKPKKPYLKITTPASTAKESAKPKAGADDERDDFEEER